MRNFIDLVEANLKLRAGTVSNARGSYGAFIVVMSPTDFLRLTTEGDAHLASIKNRPFPRSKEDYEGELGEYGYKSGEFDLPFLKVRFPSGKVFGHEGRHRAAMIEASGGKSFPVAIYPYEEQVHVVKAQYVDDDDNDHHEEMHFDNYDDARNHEWDVRMAGLRDDPRQDGRRYSTSSLTTINGGSLRGAPARSSKEDWQHAAWRKEDFPAQLINQYEACPRVTNFKVGIVKGYRHHREPGEIR